MHKSRESMMGIQGFDGNTGPHDSRYMRLPHLQVNVQQVWLSFSSSLLAFVFIFGNNIRNIYESCLLLFVVHPFDVGDVLFLDKDQWCQVSYFPTIY